jgi:hypothetical protein
VIAGGDVIARHTIASKRARVTLPEHAALIRAAAAVARRPQRPKKTFEQLPLERRAEPCRRRLQRPARRAGGAGAGAGRVRGRGSGSMSDSVHYERAREHLEALGLGAALSELDTVLDTAAREERAPAWVLDQLLSSERATRFERRVNANLKLSGIPNRKTLDAFDYDAQPGVPKRVVDELATLRFVRDGHNVLILGPPASARPTWPSASPSRPSSTATAPTS